MNTLHWYEQPVTPKQLGLAFLIAFGVVALIALAVLLADSPVKAGVIMLSL